MDPPGTLNKMNNKKITKNILLSLVIMTILASNILAFAISSAYYKGYPLYIPAGETKNIQMLLQNTEANDLTIKAEVTNGGDIVQITDPSSIYLVKANGKTFVNLKVTVPSDAKTYQDYSINLIFSESAGNGVKTLGLTSSIGQNFEVIAAESAYIPPKTNLTLILGLVIAGVLVIVILAFLFVNKKRNKRR
jgi:hypothetical protein